MRFQAPLLSLSLALLAGCGSSTASMSSDNLNASQIEAIEANIERLHPAIDSDLKLQVLEVAVKSAENMVFIEGGEFEMGDFGWPCEPGSSQTCNIDSDRDSKPAHSVSLDSYHLAKYETTVHQFDQFRLAQGKEIYHADRRDDLKFLAPGYPSLSKDWQEVKDYCLWLGALTALPIDLPSEAQWEFAARNRGQKVLFATDNGEVDRGRNYEPNGQSHAMTAGSYPPNPLGIHDLSGNVSEWVDDWFAEDYYAVSPFDNPKGPTTGTQKILRGANFGESLSPVVMRHPRAPVAKKYYSRYGFRCSLQQAKPL